MVDDTPRVADPVALPARAGVALLTLQLRSALQAATAAEAEEAGWNLGVALAQLRARLEPLVEDRRRAHGEALAQAESDAAAAIAAAHAEAALIVAQAAPHPDLADLDVAGVGSVTAAEQPTATEAVVPEPVLGDPVLEPALDGEHVEAAIVDAEPVVVEPVVVEPAVVEHAEPEAAVAWDRPPDPDAIVVVDDVWRPVALPQQRHAGLYEDPREPITVVLDADSFARAFAAAITPVLEARAEILASNRPITLMPAPVKKSFWSDTWHADVLLSAIALIIVIVVIIAWST